MVIRNCCYYFLNFMSFNFCTDAYAEGDYIKILRQGIKVDASAQFSNIVDMFAAVVILILIVYAQFELYKSTKSAGRTMIRRFWFCAGVLWRLHSYFHIFVW